MLPLLGDVDLATKAGKYVIYVLAVAGGFLIGNILSLFICRLLAKFAFKQRINHRLEQAVRILGGIAVALLVAYLLFQFGPGWGLGGSGNGEGKDSGGQTPGSENLGKDQPIRPKTTIGQDTAIVSRLVVTIQPATDYPKTFRFEGEPTAIDLRAAIKKLDDLKSVGGNKLQVLELRVFKNSSAVGTGDVHAFREHADQIGILTHVDMIDRRLE